MKIDSILKTAFILGAGLGTRLRPLTEHCPKPLLRIGGRPIITYAMDHLMTVGINRFIVNTHHCPDVYEAEFPDHQWRGMPIIFRYEPVLLDSAGGLKNIEDLLDDGEKAIVAYNPDIITNLPLQPLIESHFGCGAEVTLTLRSSGYLVNVNIDKNGNICDIRNILGRPGIKNCQFASIYIVERCFLDRLQAGRIESVVDVFIRMIGETPGAIRGIVIDDGTWDTIVDIEAYKKISALFAENR